MDALHHALVVAARDGKTGLVRDILRKGVQPTAMSGGDSALHSAAAAGHGAVVTLLLSEGADVNGLNLRGDAPLREALRI